MLSPSLASLSMMASKPPEPVDCTVMSCLVLAMLPASLLGGGLKAGAVSLGRLAWGGVGSDEGEKGVSTASACRFRGAQL